MTNRTCCVDGCEKPQLARKWCRAHYRNWLYRGSPLARSSKALSPEERFWAKVEIGDCWVWKGALVSGGYGLFTVGSRGMVAHRWLWQTLVGPVPKDLVLDHLCRVPACVNPDHLEPVSQWENCRRGNNASLGRLR